MLCDLNRICQLSFDANLACVGLHDVRELDILNERKHYLAQFKSVEVKLKF